MTFQLLVFISAKPGLSAAEFKKYYEETHVKTSIKLGVIPPVIYKRFYLQKDDEVLCWILGASAELTADPQVNAGVQDLKWSVVDHFGFESRESMKRWQKAILADELVQDELQFIDRGGNSTCVIEHVDGTPGHPETGRWEKN